MLFYTYDNLLQVDVYYLKIETSIIKIFDIYVAIIAQISILRGEQKYCFFPKSTMSKYPISIFKAAWYLNQPLCSICFQKAATKYFGAKMFIAQH